MSAPGTKLMYAAWGDDLPATLRDPSLRDALRAAGVRRLQLNLDDADVAGAMRIPGLDPPVGAVVSVWLADGTTVPEVTDALQQATRRTEGWRVDERTPIPPPAGEDGVRMDTLANVALIRRPDELSDEEWRHRWLVDHTPVAIATQATFGYVQNIVVEAVTPGAPYVSALVEELFPSAGVHDVHAFYGSGGDDAELGRRLEAMMASVGRFGADRGIDLVPSSRYCYTL